MILFLIKSTLCLTILYVFYIAFLENQKTHQFNRFYLLGALIFSIAVPNFIFYLNTSITSPINNLAIVSTSSFQISNFLILLLTIYLVIALVLLMRFINNIINIVTKIMSHKKIVMRNATLVLVEEEVLPHTFLNYIFINKDDYELSRIQDELFTHELTHVNEKHSIDVLLVEFFQIIFWFNPIVFLMNKSIRLNHEFIADQTVIDMHKNISNYQYLLLDVATWNNTNFLTTNLNYSLTKKRLQMMIKKSSYQTKWVVKFSVIPLLVISVFLFSTITASQEHSEGEHSRENPTSVSEHHKEGSEENHTE